MKIAGQDVAAPIVEGALKKLAQAGKSGLEDGDVQNADEANRLLNIVENRIVNES
jgi:hypothetical protein